MPRNPDVSTQMDELVEALLEFDVERMKDLAATALSEKISPIIIIEEGIARGLREIGRRYEEGELFVTHLVAAAEAARVTIDEILTPAMSQMTTAEEPLEKHRTIRPKVVMATVEGDIHDIGKNIVGAMLFAAGFDVIDIGRDVPVEKIVAAVKRHKPALLGLSSLLSTTMVKMPLVLKTLKEEGLRETVKVMVGGGPVTAQWAKNIGADGYGANAADAVKLAKSLLES
ncbi:MAG: B12-binding domain-containing protein [Promethearchaeota archaeon]